MVGERAGAPPCGPPSVFADVPGEVDRRTVREARSQRAPQDWGRIPAAAGRSPPQPEPRPALSTESSALEKPRVLSPAGVRPWPRWASPRGAVSSRLRPSGACSAAPAASADRLTWAEHLCAPPPQRRGGTAVGLPVAWMSAAAPGGRSMGH